MESMNYKYFTYISLLLLYLFSSCANSEKSKKETYSNSDEEITQGSFTSTFSNRWLTASDIIIDENLDLAKIEEGEKIFTKLCMACHRPNRLFIGPALNDVVKRRKPEWIMNMILDPEAWVKEDSTANMLFEEFDGAPMLDQNLNIEEARAVLEYLRTLSNQ